MFQKLIVFVMNWRFWNQKSLNIIESEIPTAQNLFAQLFNRFWLNCARFGISYFLLFNKFIFDIIQDFLWLYLKQALQVELHRFNYLLRLIKNSHLQRYFITIHRSELLFNLSLERRLQVIFLKQGLEHFKKHFITLRIKIILKRLDFLLSSMHLRLNLTYQLKLFSSYSKAFEVHQLLHL